MPLLAGPTAVIVEGEAQRVLAFGQLVLRLDLVHGSEVVVADLGSAALEIETHAGRAGTRDSVLPGGNLVALAALSGVSFRLVFLAVT